MYLKIYLIFLLVFLTFSHCALAEMTGPGRTKMMTGNMKPGRYTDVSPLITVAWDQGCFYNADCPPDTSSHTSCFHACAGSGAVAMAQIMKYYNYPPHGFNSFSYTLPGYGTLYVNFGTTTYDWLNMPQSLTASNDAVATLIYDCGVGQEMNYGPLLSSSLPSIIDSAFRNYFGYNPGAAWKWKADYSSDQWVAMLQAELNAGRPLLYYGNNGGSDEKFFICDGYQGTGSFHFNWGAGGTDDGYFNPDSLTPGTHNYSYGQGAIFNLLPSQPGDTLNMDFESVSDFSLAFTPWTVRDVNGDSTYGIQGHTFPNNGSPMAFIAFNPALVNPSMSSDTALQPHSGSRFGACFAGLTQPDNNWFISPQIQLDSNGQFSFWERSYTDQYGLEKFNVLVSTTNNNPESFTVISGSTPVTAPLQWTKKTYSLSAYNNQKVYVAIQCVSDNAFIFMIDDLEVKPHKTSMLSADFIASQTSIRAGQEINFTDESSGNPTSWTWSFPGGFPAGANQQDPANIRYDFPGTYNVSLKISNGSGTDSITKSGYITVTGHPSYMSLDFESLADFTLNFDPWSVYDVNGGVTYSIDSVSFPNSGAPMAFICFNPSQAVPPPVNMSAHSGKKFGACFSSMPPHNPNDKWLISPQMTLGSDASISFWVQTYNTYYGLEEFNVGISTTGNDPADFILVNTSPVDAPGVWTKESFTLTPWSGRNVYIGINCVSDDQFIFMVDDIEIGSALWVQDQAVTTSATLYPNPAKDHVFVSFSNQEVFVTDMTLMNETGTILKDYPINRMTGEIFNIHLPVLPSGIYYLVINSGNGRIVKKIAVLN
jgi:PKD repeat protein